MKQSPPSVISAPLTVFKRQLKTFLFDNSFCDYIFQLCTGTIFCLCHINLHVLIIVIIGPLFFIGGLAGGKLETSVFILSHSHKAIPMPFPILHN